jgi:tetrahydromethanopterin S-methyltransferase subunit C
MHCNRMALLFKELARGTVLGALTLRIVRENGRILEDTMKKLALAAALSVVATGAFAGGYVEPAVIEPVVIVEDTSSSAGGILVPVLALILIAAAVAANN